MRQLNPKLNLCTMFTREEIAAHKKKMSRNKSSSSPTSAKQLSVKRAQQMQAQVPVSQSSKTQTKP